MPPSNPIPTPKATSWKTRVYAVVFRSETRAGRGFDLALLVLILVSVIVTVLDSLEELRKIHGRLLMGLEWFFTVVFALEYALRLACAPRPARYARSFLGCVDLVGWLPTVVGLLIPGAHYLTTFRVVRVLRIFRILKLTAYLDESTALATALRNSSRKIAIFFFYVLTVVMLMGSLMYLIEGPENGFTSIPVSIYWAIVTLTTVGYGDISPQTPAGQFLSSLVMLTGYAIIAVPTGIVSSEMLRSGNTQSTPCPACSFDSNPVEAKFCARCGTPLANNPRSPKESLPPPPSQP